MTDLIVSPRTGEALTLYSPTVDLAGLLADLKDYENGLKDTKRAISDELLRRLDANASWTEHLPGLKLSAPSPAPVVAYDAPALRDALLDLVDESLLTVEAVDRAVEMIVSYKASAAGVKALVKLGGRVAETVAAHAASSERTRYVSVARA